MDRNADGTVSGSGDYVSLSARRAWIEIIPSNGTLRSTHVALRKESVDRNCLYLFSFVLVSRRSPQGERG